MTFGDHTYTRLVRGLKVALPLIALVLLSTMFMLSRKIDPTAAAALSDRAFRERIDNQQLSNPRYAGNTNSGKAMTVTAQSARPDPTGTICAPVSSHRFCQKLKGNLLVL